MFSLFTWSYISAVTDVREMKLLSRHHHSVPNSHGKVTEWLSLENRLASVLPDQVTVPVPLSRPPIQNCPPHPIEFDQFEGFSTRTALNVDLSNGLPVISPMVADGDPLTDDEYYTSPKEELRSIASDFYRHGRHTRCKLCPYETRRPEHMYRHIRSVHRNNRQYSCDRCGRKFVRKDYVTSHMRICRGAAH